MRSLEEGPSKIVPIKTPDSEKQALLSVLRDGETISGITRELWAAFVKKRLREAKKAKP